jgi:hypothetical protein|tara:strand:+ start:1258 stop:1941 length:684 start_codon:yes stop_codon:yes gene_type:complete
MASRIDKVRLMDSAILIFYQKVIFEYGEDGGLDGSDLWDDLYPAEDKYYEDCLNYLSPNDFTNGFRNKLEIENWINDAFINLKSFYDNNWEVQVYKENEDGEEVVENVLFYEKYNLIIPELKLSDLFLDWTDDNYDVKDHMFEIIEDKNNNFEILYHLLSNDDDGWYSESVSEWNEFWDKVLDDGIEKHLFKGQQKVVKFKISKSKSEAEKDVQNLLSEFKNREKGY